jgi:Tol biopolymer transport system component/DNA-binding winged helix-turn-helix (wHTH) protein
VINEPEGRFYEFGPFRLDISERLLLRNGEVVPLTPKAFDTLLALVESGGHILDKDKLMRSIWPDSFVEEVNLAHHISTLRKALGESRNGEQYIQTVPRRGYRFIAKVNPLIQESRSDGAVEVKEELDSGRHIQVVTPERGHRTLKWIAMFLVILGIGTIALWLGRTTRHTSSTPLRPIPLTSYPGLEMFPTFSPDGNQVAFVANKDQSDNFDIYVKLIGSSEPLRLTRHPAAEYSPAWSPDGRQIAFLQDLTGGKAAVLAISALGGPATKLAEVQGLISATYRYNYLAWSQDGSSLIIVDKPSEAIPQSLFSLSLSTRETRRLTFPATGLMGDSNPVISPDGGTLAFVRIGSHGGTSLQLLSLSANMEPVGKPEQLTSAAVVAAFAWSADGHSIIFDSVSDDLSSSSSLWRIALSGARVPEPLIFVGQNSRSPAISRQGHRLVYAQRLREENIWRVEVPNPQGKAGRPVRFISTTRDDSNPHYSRSGQKIVFASDRSGSYQIWVCDSDGSNPMPLTSFDNSVNGVPRWSPGGEQIAFDSYKERGYQVYVVGANGGEPRLLTPHSSANAIPSWSRDGKWVYFASNRSGEIQIWKMPAEGGGAIRVTQNGGIEAFESPDGASVYYTKADGTLWKIPVAGGQEVKVLHSVLSRTFAVGNNGIYFCTKPERSVGWSIRVLDFATGNVKLIANTERPVSVGLSVSPDERWVLYSQVDQEESDLMLVENFR